MHRDSNPGDLFHRPIQQPTNSSSCGNLEGSGVPENMVRPEKKTSNMSLSNLDKMSGKQFRL
jgi:hypothetical protein